MTSLRQIEANRRNALHGTGPTSHQGKQRSRGNAIRHGLTAETVVMVLEDRADYEAFQLAVTSDFDAQTAVERELVLRLASLLWRLRRATAIESGLLQIQSEILHDVRRMREAQRHDAGHDSGSPPPNSTWMSRHQQNGYCPPQQDHKSMLNNDRQEVEQCPDRPTESINAEVARCFLRLANLDHGAFDRLGRYEATLWRQVGQLLLTLSTLHRTR